MLTSLSASAETQPVPRSGTVVYVQRGDIYVRELPEGTARRLTNDGKNEDPTWSPSGRWIAYYHKDRICIVRRDGSGPHSLPSWQYVYSYSFSPVAEEIAFVNDKGALAIAPLGGGKARTLVSAAADNPIVQVSWSPDGRSLAYTTEHHETIKNGRRTPYRVELCQINASGKGAPHRLAISQEHENAPDICGWSPDSRYLLYWGLLEYPAGSINMDGLPLYVCPAGRSPDAPRLLFKGGYKKGWVLHEPDFVRFAPHGSQAAVSVGGSRFWVENKRITLTNLDTHVSRSLTPASIAATCPIWSPDGRRIAYLGAPAADSNAPNEPIAHAAAQMHLWIMNADGTRQRRLSVDRVDENMGPRWIGDKWLLFERTDEGEGDTRSLWMIRVDGSGLRHIASHLGIPEDRWHPHDFDVWTSRRP